MIKVRVFDLQSGSPRDRAELVRTGFGAMAFQTLKTLAQSFRNCMSHALSRLLRDGVRESVGFGVFDIESLHFCASTPSGYFLPFYLGTLRMVWGSRVVSRTILSLSELYTRRNAPHITVYEG